MWTSQRNLRVKMRTPFWENFFSSPLFRFRENWPRPDDPFGARWGIDQVRAGPPTHFARHIGRMRVIMLQKRELLASLSIPLVFPIPYRFLPSPEMPHLHFCQRFLRRKQQISAQKHNFKGKFPRAKGFWRENIYFRSEKVFFGSKLSFKKSRSPLFCRIAILENYFKFIFFSRKFLMK